MKHKSANILFFFGALSFALQTFTSTSSTTVGNNEAKIFLVQQQSQQRLAKEKSERLKAFRQKLSSINTTQKNRSISAASEISAVVKILTPDAIVTPYIYSWFNFCRNEYYKLRNEDFTEIKSLGLVEVKSG